MNLLNQLFETDGPGGSACPTPRGSSCDGSLWASRRSSQDDKIPALERRIGQLNLLVAALVRSLVQQELLKPADLSELMKQIDLEDGIPDGQLGAPRPNTPEWCPKCEAKIPQSKTYCVFCGAQFGAAAAADPPGSVERPF